MDELIRKIQEEYSGERLCQNYFSFLAQLEESNDQALLKAVVSYHLKPSEVRNPFISFLILDGKSSLSPQDLTEGHLQSYLAHLKALKMMSSKQELLMSCGPRIKE